jgi:hypothetical protein
MNVVLIFCGFGVRFHAFVETANGIAPAAAGAVFNFKNSTSHRPSVSCIFSAEGFSTLITFKNKYGKLNWAMEFASCLAGNRRPADDSYETKSNWKGGEL